jgi:hypothetical protein
VARGQRNARRHDPHGRPMLARHSGRSGGTCRKLAGRCPAESGNRGVVEVAPEGVSRVGAAPGPSPGMGGNRRPCAIHVARQRPASYGRSRVYSYSRPSDLVPSSRYRGREVPSGPGSCVGMQFGRRRARSPTGAGGATVSVAGLGGALLGDQFEGGVVQQITLIAGKVQALVHVGVDLQVPDISAHAEVAPPQRVHRDPGPGEGLVQ